MKVVVCIKQTPSTTAVFRVSGGTVSWDDPGGKPNILNPWDEYAVEEAIKTQESHGGEAIAITVGTDESQEALKTCLAMGCSEAILVSDSAFAGSDTLGTARVLAAAINKLGGVQVAMFGRQAIDGDTGQTTVQTAQKLGWTPLTFVAHIKALDEAAGTITVDRQVEEGRETVTAKLPVVLSFVKEINEPRYPSFMGIRKANRADYPGLDGGRSGGRWRGRRGASKVDWSNVYPLPARDTQAEMIDRRYGRRAGQNPGRPAVRGEGDMSGVWVWLEQRHGEKAIGRESAGRRPERGRRLGPAADRAGIGPGRGRRGRRGLRPGRRCVLGCDDAGAGRLPGRSLWPAGGQTGQRAGAGRLPGRRLNPWPRPGRLGGGRAGCRAGGRRHRLEGRWRPKSK
jgi:electron transfer flavoprotein beta subunit